MEICYQYVFFDFYCFPSEESLRDILNKDKEKLYMTYCTEDLHSDRSHLDNTENQNSRPSDTLKIK